MHGGHHLSLFAHYWEPLSRGGTHMESMILLQIQHGEFVVNEIEW